MISIEVKIWMVRNKIETYPPAEGPNKKWSAILTFPKVWKKRRMIEHAEMTGDSERKAIQNLCDDNNILSYWEVESIKNLLKPKTK